jgi:citrate lyase subunit beta/citryl-CoA lyase
MPAANARALDKARDIDADALIFDLEDAVAPDAKDVARDQATAAVRDGGYGHRELVIRANGAGTQWHTDDLAAAAAAGPDAVLVPKVDSPDQVAAIEAALRAHGAPESTAIWAMLETPRAVLRAAEICAASARLTVLVLGTNDLAKELRAHRVADRAPLLPSLGLCLLGARATGKVIIDGVFNDISDADGFAAECRQSRDLGFDGKTLIHPSQVVPCNEIFSPTDDDIEFARRVISAFDTATDDGRGVLTVDGRMIENLHVDEARRVLAVVDSLQRQD